MTESTDATKENETEQDESSESADTATSEADAASDDAAKDEDAEPAGEVEQLTREMEELKAERDEINEKLLRKAAEFENFRKRMSEEKRRRYEAGKVDVVRPILEVLDDFERSLDAASDLDAESDPETAYESLKGGVEMVYRKFLDELKGMGVEPIDAEGEPFDEAYHEAMMRQPTDDADPGTVVQEIRKGYVMGDRVIRHSRVIVAAEPDS